MIFGFWIIHFTYILVILKFPFFGKRWLAKNTRLIHAITVPIVVLTGAIGPVVVAIVSPYTVSAFPAVSCFAASLDATFYCLILPSTVLLLIGCIMMVFLLQQLHKVYACRCACIFIYRLCLYMQFMYVHT